ncbi:(2Fe-2S)-binding protein [Inquilinus sp. CAU 1745]|uniref:(2Fe-2S)-binding protein n=1 Tax=Inquilinus sp. CAU 1745 TaxID=3140369 RepID=UPI00325A6F6E
MYICICNALTDRQIRTVMGEGEVSAGKVYARLGCAPQCGKCVSQVRDMVREHREACAQVPLVAAE